MRSVPSTARAMRRQDRATGSRSAPRSRARRALQSTELLTGGSALLCGGLLAVRPDGSWLGLPPSVLDDGPFTDWRLPGLLLGGLVGVGYLTAAAAEQRRHRRSAELSVLAGVGLVCFEAVEWKWLGFHPLQAVFMAVGAAVVGLACAENTPT
jgi:hypothetical protein